MSSTASRRHRNSLSVVLLSTVLVLSACGDETAGIGNNGSNNEIDTNSNALGDVGTGDDLGLGNDVSTDSGGDTEGGGDPDANVADDVNGEDVPFTGTDTDGDFIPDGADSCFVDTDLDQIVDCEDLDSDNDGISDTIEAGDFDLATAPPDTDEDGVPDFRDFDSDNDGIDDRIEGTGDPDGDGVGNWLDTDSDGDRVPDSAEGVEDPDGDLIPNFLDLDSDNDTISDRYESFEDTDADEIPDRYDLDSDSDTILDSLEAGDADLTTNPIDSDDDDIADFRDQDSDNDGLTDDVELGCPASSERLDEDSDDDTYTDLAEVAVGSDPCSASSDVFDYVEFFFVLPFEGDEESAPLQFGTDLRQVDVHFNMDTTGSMSGEIDNLQADIVNTIIPGVESALAAGSNVAFGVSEFRDFPIGDFGNPGDLPFRLRQRVTTNSDAAQAGANVLTHGGGDDFPESGWESLYQIATGNGGVSWSGGSTPAFNPAANRVVGVADGEIGGVGFRAGSLPIVVHITDAVSHASTDYGSSVTGEHSESQAISSMNAISARVIGVASGSSPYNELIDLAEATFATVPVCFFETSDNSCGTNRCCTGEDGAGVIPRSGVCPLVFSVGSDGDGLGPAVVDAISALANSGTLDVTTRVIRDEAEFTASGVDTGCFISAVIPNSYSGGDSCAAGSIIQADVYPPTGVDDSFLNVTPGTDVFFDVIAENADCVEPTDEPQVFHATIEVVGDEVTILDSLEVTIIVPPFEFIGPKD